MLHSDDCFPQQSCYSYYLNYAWTLQQTQQFLLSNLQTHHCCETMLFFHELLYSQLQAPLLLNCSLFKLIIQINNINNYYMDISPLDCPTVPFDFHLKLRKRFHEKLIQKSSQLQDFNNSISLFKGIPTIPKNYEDVDYTTQQQSTFWYLFGVKQPDVYAVIHNSSGKSVLFVPYLDENYKLWMKVKSNQEFKQQYLVDEVYFTHQLKEYLKQVNGTVYLYSGVDSDSGIAVTEPELTYIQGLNVNRAVLWPLISNLRTIKTKDELELIRYVCKLTTHALKIAVKSTKPGLTQVQLHSVFHFQHSIKSGSILLGFASICSSGRDCATLHYIDNDKIIKDGQMVLLDMGGKWHGYVADQAITFPANRQFTQKQRNVYQAVYEAQAVVEAAMKPGVKWEDMHILAETILLKHLIQMGIVNNFPLEELIENRVGAIFFPHGLGHLFGLKVHDIGGYTEGPPRSEKLGLSKLRTRRTLEAGMCITVEPGLYFIDFKIQNSLKDPAIKKYLNAQKLLEYKEVGGVRLEDDVVITEDGIQRLSSLPRSLQELQKLLDE